MLVYFMRKGNLFDSHKERNYNSVHQKTMDKAKLNLVPELFCEGLPKEMIEYFSYIKALKPTDKPDYTKISRMFRNMLSNAHPPKILRYDWVDRVYMHLDEILKQTNKEGLAGSGQTQSQSTSKGLPDRAPGTIELDKDENFIMAEEDDDESNIDDSETQELSSPTHDALPQTITRLSAGFGAQFIRDLDLQSKQNSRLK